MPNKRVRIQYGRTVQPKPYESLRLDVAIEKDVLDGENMTEEINKSVDGLVLYVKNKIGQVLANE